MKAKDGQLWDARFVRTLKSLAPGTTLREGLENVLRARMGALVVIGDSPEVLGLVDGGFAINCEFSPAGFYELAKMDGALVLSSDGKRILYGNAQLVPDAAVATAETGTRHRTAERFARQTGATVIAISQRRNIITLYLGNIRYTLNDITVILSRANQALQTLEKYKAILASGMNTLSALEFEDLVTLSDVASVLIRAEHVSRIATEIQRNIIELGSEGRLISMQMEELTPAEDSVLLLIRDYCVSTDAETHEAIREQLGALPEDALETFGVCRMLGYGVTPNAMDVPVVPRGYRLMSRVPRLPMPVVENLVSQFKTLKRIYQATISELDEVDGIGEVRAKAIKDGLRILREQALLDRQM